MLSGNVFMRTFRTSSAVLARKANIDWHAMRREEKMIREAEWKRFRGANPFVRNVGMARQMKSLGLDPEDQMLANDINVDSTQDPGDQMFDVWEETRKYEGEVYGKRRPEKMHSPRKMALILTKKNYFPEPEEPELLTWIEIEMIKSLHSSNPGEWTPEVLSECFPATSNIIKNVIHKRWREISTEKIRKHNEKVIKNWKLLAEKKLEISDGYLEHLSEQKHQAKDKIEALLSSSMRVEMEKQIWEKFKMEEEKRKSARLKPGEFGNIITDYKKKVEAKEKAIQKLNTKKNVQTIDKNEVAEVEVNDIFSDFSEWDPKLNLPSPYGGTSVLETGVDFKSDGRMTYEAFRKKQLDPEKMFASAISEEELEKANPIKAQYVNWLKMEKVKDKAVTKPKHVDVDEVLKEEKYEKKAEEILSMPKYKPQFRSKARVETVNEEESNEVIKLNMKSKINSRIDKIQIPKRLYKKGSLYQVKDRFYDDNGDFLYRVPM